MHDYPDRQYLHSVEYCLCAVVSIHPALAYLTFRSTLRKRMQRSAWMHKGIYAGCACSVWWTILFLCFVCLWYTAACPKCKLDMIRTRLRGAQRAQLASGAHDSWLTRQNRPG